MGVQFKRWVWGEGLGGGFLGIWAKMKLRGLYCGGGFLVSIWAKMKLAWDLEGWGVLRVLAGGAVGG